MFFESGHIQWSASIQICRRIGVDVREHLVDIVESEMSPRISIPHNHVITSLVLVDAVQEVHVFLHLGRDRSVVGRLVGPVLVRSGAMLRGIGVNRCKIQWRQIEDDKVACAARIYGIEGFVYTVDIVDQGLLKDVNSQEPRQSGRGHIDLPGNLLVLDERLVAEIIRACT